MKKSPVQVHCQYSKLVPAIELKQHPKNPNVHPAKQVRMLAKALKTQGWRSPVIVSKRSGFIVAGHGRQMAAELISPELPVPVDYQDFPSEAEEVAHLIADNKLGDHSHLDAAALSRAIEEDVRTIGMDLEALGVDDMISKAEVREVKLPPAPRTTWVLIGIPTTRFGEINQQIEQIAAIPGVLCEVAATAK